MPSFAYKDDFLSEFMNIAHEKREGIFSLSCFEPSHWEASLTWDLTVDELDDHILQAADDLLDDWQYDNLERRGQLSDLKNSFYHGDILNQFLVKYLSGELNLRCSPESTSAVAEFDVTVYKNGIELCEIGIKRVVTSNQLMEYYGQHRDKVQSVGNGRYSALLLYFPLTDASDSGRVRDFVHGYDYLAEEIYNFYNSPQHIVCSIPASLDPDDRNISPLKETKNVLVDRLGISR